jgi:hypothetical protein
MTSILLHKDKGLNPRIIETLCPVCGEVKSDSLALAGAANYKVECPECHTVNYGGFSKVGLNYHCGNPSCDFVCGTRRDGRGVELEDHETIKNMGVCKECTDFMKQGVCLISVRDGESGENPCRTGKFVVIKDEAIKEIVNDGDMAEDILKKRMCFVEDTTWEALGLPT